jgi:Mor family transcriptional regulator
VAGVITLIKEDHRKLEAVFKKLENEPDDVRGLLEQVAEMLIPHAELVLQQLLDGDPEAPGGEFTAAREKSLADLRARG